MKKWLWIWIAYSAVCAISAAFFIAYEAWIGLICLVPGIVMAIDGILGTLECIRLYGKD